MHVVGEEISTMGAQVESRASPGYGGGGADWRPGGSDPDNGGKLHSN